MDALELLKSWPDWSRAGAEAILASPAWRLPVRYGTEQGVMTVGGTCADAILLDITLDGEPNLLALADSPLYPDLHLLWSKRADLPREVLLALVEKECGGVLAMLENLVRRQLGVKGLAESACPSDRVFTVSVGAGACSFGLDLPLPVLQEIARLENLDVRHESIRTLTRPASVDYTALMLTDEERASVAPGVFLLLPENFPATQTWTVDPPAEGSVRLVSRATTEISFAAFADDRLPPVPPPEDLALVIGSVRLPCELTRVGDARAIRII